MAPPPMDGDRIRAMEDGEERPLKVVFASPAEHFTDAAPIGNGSLGAMVWGGIASEKLQLNRGALEHYIYYRILVLGMKVYQPLGDMNVEFGTSSQGYSSYKRELHLHTATTLITFTLEKCSTLGSTSAQIHTRVHATNANEIIMEGTCPVQRHVLQLHEANDATGIAFAAVLSLQMGGAAAKSVVLNDQNLRIDNADWVLLLVTDASSFNGPLVNLQTQN
ncbi:hypothetical protein ACQ4PT_038596 [Festuca glaucescens]